MHISVGPYTYNIKLVNGLIPFRGGKQAIGLCDSRRCEILISDVPPPHRRMSILWHELAHAWAADLLQERGEMSEEAMARMVGVAAANLNARDLARLQCYLESGIEPADVLFIPGVSSPIPVIHFSFPPEAPEDHLPQSN